MDEVKIILLGDPGVGKTSLINRFIHNEDSLGGARNGSTSSKGSFSRNSSYDPDVKTKEVTLSDGAKVKAYLHDSPKRDNISFNSQSLTPNFYRNADAVILVYSVDDHQTLEALQDCWITEYAMATYQDISNTAWIIVGNKNDLPLDIDKKSLDGLAVRLGGQAVSLFASAKTSNNVKEVFEIAVKKAHERRKLKEGTLNLVDKPSASLKKGGGGEASSGGGCGC